MATIHKNMTVLDCVATFEETQHVFDKYSAQIDICICCKLLFDTLEDISNKYSLDLYQLLYELNLTAEKD